MSRYIVEAPASVRDTQTGIIWFTYTDPKIAQAVADSLSRAAAARAAGCQGVCGVGPGSADCLRCWSVTLTANGVCYRN